MMVHSQKKSLNQFLSFFKRFYLFIHERHTERGRDIGRGRSRLHTGSQMWDSILGFRDHALSQRQTLNRWATQAPLRSILNTQTPPHAQYTEFILNFFPYGIFRIYTKVEDYESHVTITELQLVSTAGQSCFTYISTCFPLVQVSVYL